MYFGWDIIFDIQLCQGDWQFNVVVQCGDGFYFVYWCIFQYQLCQGFECYFFFVIIVMGVRDGCYVVMNCVCCCEIIVFEIYVVQIGVGFYYLFQCWGDYVLFGGQYCFFIFFE